VLFPKRKLIAFLFLFFLILLFFSLSSQPFTYSLRSGVFDLSKIPLLAVNGLVHETRAVVFFHRSYWQNLKCTRDNELLSKKVLNDQETLLENERLRSLLDLKQKSSFETTASAVIGKDFNALRPYIILDKGKSSGIRKYAPVITPLGLVGKVLEVGRFSSKVMLINDPDLSVPAIDARTREEGLVSGTLDGRCKLRFLDTDSDIREGDLIVTSGLNGTYPQGVAIGTVKFVGLESSGLGKFAVLNPTVHLSSLEEVLIVATSSHE
jgi:rod shape-determining protein MreC